MNNTQNYQMGKNAKTSSNESKEKPVPKMFKKNLPFSVATGDKVNISFGNLVTIEGNLVVYRDQAEHSIGIRLECIVDVSPATGVPTTIGRWEPAGTFTVYCRCLNESEIDDLKATGDAKIPFAITLKS